MKPILTIKQKCKECKGTGYPADARKNCKSCKGTGQQTIAVYSLKDFEKCKNCD